MMRVIVCSGVVALATAAWSWSGPVPGQSGQFHKLPGAADGTPQPYEMTRMFRGGERACVFVRGDHEPIVGLDVAVYDQEGNLIAKDESSKDFVAVFWTPERTAEYRIVVRNHGREWNRCYIVMK